MLAIYWDLHFFIYHKLTHECPRMYKAFHKLLHARTTNQEARQVSERLINDRALKTELSRHYFDADDREKDIKTLLHRVSNGGSPREWQRSSLPRSCAS